jgi:hypothetical protein
VQSIIKREKWLKYKLIPSLPKRYHLGSHTTYKLQSNTNKFQERAREIFWPQNFIFRECQPTEHYKPLHCRYSYNTGSTSTKHLHICLQDCYPNLKVMNLMATNAQLREVLHSKFMKWWKAHVHCWRGQVTCVYVRTCETYLCRAHDTAHESEGVDEHSDYKPKITLGPFNIGTRNSVGVVVTCLLTTAVQESNTNKRYWTPLIFCN